MENFISLGQKSHNTGQQGSEDSKFQIFSLGMTLISMCLRSCFYRTETFSEKYIDKLLHQAFEIRKVEGKELSE